MSFDEDKLVRTQTAAIQRTETVFGPGSVSKETFGSDDEVAAADDVEVEEDFRGEDSSDVTEEVKHWLALCAETEVLAQELTEQLRCVAIHLRSFPIFFENQIEIVYTC